MKNGRTKDIKLFIFDWSGTLSDDRIPVQTAFNRVAVELGLKPIEDLAEWLKKSVKVFENEYSKQLKKTKSPNEIRQLYYRHFSTLRDEGIKPIIYDTSIEVLNTIRSKGKKLALLSSHPNESLLKEIEEYGVKNYFDKVLGGILDKSTGMVQICRDLKVDIKNAAYVGDMIGDIKAARRAKMISVALAQGYHDRDTLLSKKPDYLFDNLAEIVSIL
ncbi:MAG: HAD family hydrolase [Candidatus Levyibacteriota bacterium]